MEDNNGIVTIELPMKTLGEETLLKGHTKRVKIDRYYDMHGKKIYTDEEPCEDLKGEFDFEIRCTKRECYGDRYDLWTLYLNGKKKCSIESYHLQKTQLKVSDCWGAG